MLHELFSVFDGSLDCVVLNLGVLVESESVHLHFVVSATLDFVKGPVSTLNQSSISSISGSDHKLIRIFVGLGST